LRVLVPLQCFGEKDADEEFSDADVLSAVEFDDTGDFLATGDKGGRIVIFERADAGKVRWERKLASVVCRPRRDSEHRRRSRSHRVVELEAPLLSIL
jgi:hypothetical protein